MLFPSLLQAPVPPAGNGQVNPAQTRLLQQYQHTSPMLSCRFDPTGRFVFGGAQDNGVYRWDLTNGQKTTLNGHDSWVRALTFIPGQNALITGGYEGKIIWWSVDAASPTPIRTINAHDGWVRAVAVSPNRQLLASCGNDQLVKIWNPGNGNLIRTLRAHESHVYNLAFHPGGQFLTSADLQGHVKQWDVNQGTVTRTLDATILSRYDTTFRATIGGVRSMTFNADGSLLACAGITDVTNAFAGIGKPAIVVFNWQTGQRSIVLRPPQTFQGSAWGVNFHPTGFVAAVGQGNGGALWFWQPNQAAPFATIAMPANSRDLDLHSDGHRLAIAFFDNKVRTYDMLPATMTPGLIYP
jgi:WD40 repeat protein